MSRGRGRKSEPRCWGQWTSQRAGESSRRQGWALGLGRLRLQLPPRLDGLWLGPACDALPAAALRDHPALPRRAAPGRACPSLQVDFVSCPQLALRCPARQGTLLSLSPPPHHGATLLDTAHHRHGAWPRGGRLRQPQAPCSAGHVQTPAPAVGGTGRAPLRTAVTGSQDSGIHGRCWQVCREGLARACCLRTVCAGARTPACSPLHAWGCMRSGLHALWGAGWGCLVCMLLAFKCLIKGPSFSTRLLSCYCFLRGGEGKGAIHLSRARDQHPLPGLLFLAPCTGQVEAKPCLGGSHVVWQVGSPLELARQAWTARRALSRGPIPVRLQLSSSPLPWLRDLPSSGKLRAAGAECLGMMWAPCPALLCRGSPHAAATPCPALSCPASQAALSLQSGRVL